MTTTWLDVRPETIPARLRALPAVVWRAEPVKNKNKKPTKVPYRVMDPWWKASSTDPTSWGLFEDAVETYRILMDYTDQIRGPVAGVGIVLTKTARISIFDLDRVVDEDRRLDPMAKTFIDRRESWAEYSPSGTGVHVAVLGTIPRGIAGDGIEVYGDARFIAVTGHQVPGTPDSLADAQDYLDYIVRLAEGPRRVRAPSRRPPPDDLDGALRARLDALGVEPSRVLAWNGGYAAELAQCPWATDHTSGPQGAAVLILPSGALSFTCRHAHCGARGWREFRALMER